ncbi:NAD(P)/FAD-dependent oxidoreductase [Cohnella boryungensis]|uniref:FAD-dependent oxidoreductase n=1 Tax=Cohnella boryungensis TaxID=768479 RepID=A0ABV8SBU8_9BACL
MSIVTTYPKSKGYSTGGIPLIERTDFLMMPDHELVAAIHQVGATALLSREIEFVLRVQGLIESRLVDSCVQLIWITDTGEQNVPGAIVICASDPTIQEVKALQYLEEMHANKAYIPKPIEERDYDSSVALIGAGIVNLITAMTLVENGYKVSIYSATPEPTQDEQWRKYGCTFAGNDARIFSFNESRQHHYHGTPLDEAANDRYRKLVETNGWLSCPPELLQEEDLEWIREYEAYPQWMFEKIQHEIIQFNRESYDCWNRMILDYPEMFHNSGYIGRLFRVYSSEGDLLKGRKSEREIGAYVRELHLSDYEQELPCFSQALNQERLSGGIEVKGFGLNIHKFSHQLINRLREAGVDFYWEEEISSIKYTSSGRVEALISSKRAIKAKHVVASPGVPSANFLQGMASDKQIGSMLGCWLTLPNDELNLRYPIKVGRSGYASEEAAAGANLIPGTGPDGKPLLYLSSGHGFIGLNPNNISKGHLNSLAKAVHETAESLFPEVYQQSLRNGLIPEEPRYCIRPWTPSCLGLLEVKPNAEGGLFILTGGHNTGGFAQSPAIARAVLDAIEGKANKMHFLYHPERLRRFFNFVPKGSGLLTYT